MATAHEHYREAERLITTAAGLGKDEPGWAAEYLAAAQVHATLAVAATRWDQGSAGEPVVGSGGGGNAAPTQAQPADPDPQDTCRVGDPDPTRWGWDRPTEEEQACGVFELHGPAGLPTGYVCSRDLHSAGQHVAGNGTRVAAVWPQSTPDGGAP